MRHQTDLRSQLPDAVAINLCRTERWVNGKKPCPSWQAICSEDRT
jgi:hypothetical protein